MSLKGFWNNNKKGFIISAITFSLIALFMGTIKKYPMDEFIPVVLFCIPLMFLMAYGIYELIGGKK